MMDLHVDDAGFVRAPAPLVYRRLTDIRRWPTWWPGCRILDRGVPGEERFLVELTPGIGRRLRVAATPGDWRHEHGFGLTLTGDLDGRAEFWLEHLPAGTVVHHLLVARTPRSRPQTVLRDHRRAIRRGLWGLKDALQVEARTSAGLQP